MNATRHTPGPWHVSKDDVSVCCATGLICTSGHPSQHENQSHNEIAANACLIAAAPAMLTALHAARNELMFYATRRQDDTALWQAFEAINVAIAKAEGRA